MRRLFILHLLVVVTLFSSCKKDVLHWQHIQQLNSGTVCSLTHARFLNDSVCVAAGGVIWLQTAVIRSTDGGYTWRSVSVPTQKEMFGMSISPSGTMYLCGVDGDVLHSKDNGESWQFNRIADWMHYVSGTFPSPDTGIFIYTVLQEQCCITRIDSNFNIIDKKNYLFGLNNIYMTSPSTGYIIGYGTVMKTTDGGNNWNFQDVKGDNFMSMDIHGDEIWMCGFNGSVFHTIDGGAHWDRQRNGNDITISRYSMQDIVFKDEQNGWAVCDNGKVIHSDDGGKHWAEYDQFTTSSLRSITICPNGDLLVAGDNGALYRILPKQ